LLFIFPLSGRNKNERRLVNQTAYIFRATGKKQ